MKTRLCLILTATVLSSGFAVRAGAPTSQGVGSLAPSGPMLAPRSGHSATLLADGKVLIAGGMRRNQDFYRSAELYDPATGKFEPTGDMAMARVGHAAVLLRSGKVLIAGGWVGDGGTDSAELYDPATGKFTATSKMTTRRARPSATLLANGDVLLAGGKDHDAPGATLASAEIFHPETLSFRPTGAMHHARVSHTATLLRDGRVLMVGGRGGQLIATAELYDQRTGTFSETGSLITARYKHTAGLLPDGRVLVAGGSDERDWHGTLNSAEIYDSRTGKFTATAPLNGKRFKLPDEAVPLPSGRLMIAGGSREVEVFDPASGKFLVVPDRMPDERHFMSATRLKDGAALLAGGYYNDDLATAQTWLYRP